MTSREQVSRVYIPDLGTDDGCIVTLAHMRDVVRIEQWLPVCRQCADDIAATLEECSQSAYVEACYAFVHRFMTFREDHVSFAAKFGQDGSNVEFLQAPSWLLAQTEPMGDCDCYCMLLATLLTIKGVPCSFAVISQPDSPDSFSHVYVVAYPDYLNRVALDASHGQYVGWEYPNTVRYYEVPV